jgi:hypothetical protein
MAAAISAPGARRLGRVSREWETRQRDETPGQGVDSGSPENALVTMRNSEGAEGGFVTSGMSRAGSATIRALGRQATAFTEKLPPPDTTVGVEQELVGAGRGTTRVSGTPLPGVASPGERVAQEPGSRL